MLTLTVEDRSVVDALATQATPPLTALEIEGDITLSSADVETLIEPVRRPALTQLILRGVTIDGVLPSRQGVTLHVEAY